MKSSKRQAASLKHDLLNLTEGALVRDLFQTPSRTEVLHGDRKTEPGGGANILPFNEGENPLLAGLKALGIAVWRLNLRSGVVDLDDETRAMFRHTLGLDPLCLDEGRYGFASHTHPDDRDRILSLLASTAEANGLEKPLVTHFRVIDAGGDTRWISLKVAKNMAAASSQDENSMWFFAENQTATRGEDERQKRALADRILAALLNTSLDAIEPKAFDSHSLIDAVGAKWADAVGSKHIRWIAPDSAPTGMATLISGSEALLQILMDALLENAIDALTSSPGLHSWIRFELFEDDESLFMAVSDSGPGVPLVHRGSIFDPFFSTHPERSSGLGLTLARSAAEWHGGTLRLDHFSKNTRFIAQIPKKSMP